MRLILFLLFLPGFLQAQDFDSASVKNLLCKKWQVDYVLQGGKKVEVREIRTMTFNNDHKFDAFPSDNDEKDLEYTWAYHEGSQAIMIEFMGVGKWPPLKLLSISEQELELEIQEGQIVHFIAVKKAK